MAQMIGGYTTGVYNPTTTVSEGRTENINRQILARYGINPGDSNFEAAMAIMTGGTGYSPQGRAQLQSLASSNSAGASPKAVNDSAMVGSTGTTTGTSSSGGTTSTSVGGTGSGTTARYTATPAQNAAAGVATLGNATISSPEAQAAIAAANQRNAAAAAAQSATDAQYKAFGNSATKFIGADGKIYVREFGTSGKYIPYEGSSEQIRDQNSASRGNQYMVNNGIGLTYNAGWNAANIPSELNSQTANAGSRPPITLPNGKSYAWNGSTYVETGNVASTTATTTGPQPTSTTAPMIGAAAKPVTTPTTPTATTGPATGGGSITPGAASSPTMVGQRPQSISTPTASTNPVAGPTNTVPNNGTMNTQSRRRATGGGMIGSLGR